MKHREAVTPALLEILRKANTNAKTLLKQDTYMAHMYALYLLAYFRENQAYPIIVDFFSMPGDISLDLTGDVVTEDLDRILASVSCGDTGLMQMLVENEKANEYVRNAALRGITTLVACGEKTRDEVISYFKKLYQGGLERRPSCVWSALIDCSMDLYPKEVCDDINNAYAEDLVESFFSARRDADCLQKVLASNPEEILSKLKGNPRYSLIKDPVSEMETWGCFEQPKKKWNSSNRNQKIDTSGFVATPVRNENKVGRNEPCPCGSGKKYKKCCLK